MSCIFASNNRYDVDTVNQRIILSTLRLYPKKKNSTNYSHIAHLHDNPLLPSDSKKHTVYRKIKEISDCQRTTFLHCESQASNKVSLSQLDANILHGIMRVPTAVHDRKGIYIRREAIRRSDVLLITYSTFEILNS